MLCHQVSTRNFSTQQFNEYRVGYLAQGARVVGVTAGQSGGISGAQAGAALISVSPAEAQAISLAIATGKVFVSLSTQDTGALTHPVLTPELILGR